VMFYQDYIKEANEKITENLKRWDCFDLNFPTKLLEQLFWLLKERNLAYNDPGLEEFNGMTTIVVGRKDADFERHEAQR